MVIRSLQAEPPVLAHLMKSLPELDAPLAAMLDAHPEEFGGLLTEGLEADAVSGIDDLVFNPVISG